VGVTARLGLDDALAAALGPAAVLGAPVRDADVLGVTAGVAAVVGGVATGSSSGGSKSSKNNS